jgi:hypothetical protein
MRHNTKLACNNPFSRLKPEPARQVEQWLFEENLSYKEILRRCLADYGIKASCTPLFNFHRKLQQRRTADRIFQHAAGKLAPPAFEVIAPVELDVRNKLRRLHPARAKRLERWLCEDNLSQAEVIRRCAREFNLRVSHKSVMQFFRLVQYRRTVARLREKSPPVNPAATEPATEKCPENRIQIYEALLKIGGSRAFEKMVAGADPADDAFIRDFTKLLSSARREDFIEQRLAFDREKWEFDVTEACLKKLPQLKAISSKASVPYREKIRLIRLRLFGSAPDRLPPLESPKTLPAPSDEKPVRSGLEVQTLACVAPDSLKAELQTQTDPSSEERKPDPQTLPEPDTSLHATNVDLLPNPNPTHEPRKS